MKRSEEIFRRVMERDQNLLDVTKNEMNPEIFTKAVEMICRARDIYVLGVRNCAPMAEYMAFYLNQVFPHVRLIHTNSSSEIFEQMLHVEERDVVIGISFPRYSMRVLKALEYSNSRNAGIITLTDSINSPICLYSSCNLVAETELSTVVDSMTAPLSVINALTVAVCAKKKKQVAENLTELDRIWDDFPVDNHDEINKVDPEMKMKSGQKKRGQHG
ncbi:MAG: MurR/RpiR family transcriptional regulator [Lachnospiraceae bacterium]|jgi:DNA-binding MurR/RpiR family transcriptional regulator|nr:MurR/RpiR family transcriptional regulator [Lachnospiraceae bacterium]MCI1726753.1 MurR/RpiR family transcriptional regulator [Lachnospiraceae bacterium]